MYCRNFTVFSSFFRRQKTKIYNESRKLLPLKHCNYHGNIEISLDLKVYFSLVTCKINNLIALRSTNQITETPAP